MRSLTAVLITGFLSAACAEDLPWPEDFESNVEARESERAAAKTAVLLVVDEAVDARARVFAEMKAQTSLWAEYLRLVESNATAFDSAATIGIMLFLR